VVTYFVVNFFMFFFFFGFLLGFKIFKNPELEIITKSKEPPNSGVAQKQGHKQTKCKTCIYWTANTLSKLHVRSSQWPPKFCPETSKEIAFFIIERLEVFKELDRSDLILLCPLASFLKVLRPTQITWSDFLDTIAPFDKTKDKNTTHWLPQITTSRILTKNYTHPFCDRPCKLNGLLQSFGVPKIRVLAFEARQQNLDTNKTQTQILEKSCWLLSRPLELLIIPPCSTIIPRFKIDILPPWIHCAANCFCNFPWDKDL